jgi:hypothetical protein
MFKENTNGKKLLKEKKKNTLLGRSFLRQSLNLLSSFCHKLGCFITTNQFKGNTPIFPMK